MSGYLSYALFLLPSEFYTSCHNFFTVSLHYHQLLLHFEQQVEI